MARNHVTFQVELLRNGAFQRATGPGKEQAQKTLPLDGPLSSIERTLEIRWNAEDDDIFITPHSRLLSCTWGRL